jgi:hypothetical protein
MDAHNIVEILDHARKLAEADGNESFPDIMFYPKEMEYIQKVLDLTTYNKQDYIDALMELANGDDVFANLDSLTIEQLKALWDDRIDDQIKLRESRLFS